VYRCGYDGLTCVGPVRRAYPAAVTGSGAVVAHLLWEQEVGGSNPPSPTMLPTTVDRRAATRALTWVLVRSLTSVVVVLLVYYNVPLTVEGEVGTLGRFALAGIAIVAILVWQVRGITEAVNPWLRAVEALAVTVTLAVVAFALGYVAMSRHDPSSFNEDLTRTDALYFTLTTLATVGYGDIHARTQSARVVVMVQMVFNVTVIGVSVRLILGAARRGALSRREETPDA
jgi:hypothetical protein